jgi:multidrug efflux system outer membrane protein
MKRFLSSVTLMAWAMACHPTLYTPRTDLPATYSYSSTFSDTPMSADCAWWRVFRDTTLNRLIDYALANNSDVGMALSRVDVARLQMGVAREEYLPAIDASVSLSGSHTTTTTQSYQVVPQLSWELSLFGALRNATAAARERWVAEEWTLRGVQLTLSAEVASAYFQLLGYERNLYIAEQSLSLREESATLIDSLFQHGMATGVALQQARSLVYTAAADIPSYKRSIRQMQLSLATLLGVSDIELDTRHQGEELLEDYQPIEIPIGLPAELLQRRPDICAAQHTLRAYGYDATLARSQRFPSIALTASGGVASSSLKHLTANSHGVWSLAGELTQPLFAFGKFKRQEQIAIESYKQQALSYEQTLLQAFAEVEKALVAIATYRQQAISQSQLVVADSRISEMNRQLYRNGMSAYLDVIDAERELYASQMQFINIAVQQYLNYIELYKALGGGW